MTPRRAVVIGASGGIGGALVDALRRRGAAVEAFARTGARPIDITSEASIAAAAASLADGPPISLVFVASGLLHAADVAPEKSWRDLDADSPAKLFAVNATGPALVAKHFLPLLPRRGRSVFAALSARVGSIGDNRLGGWYGYRASKAALNMLVKTLSIELARGRPEALCVSLHPGTVDTPLSKPFQRGVDPEKLFEPALAAEQLLTVIDHLTPADSGGCFDWAGERLAP